MIKNIHAAEKAAKSTDSSMKLVLINLLILAIVIIQSCSRSEKAETLIPKNTEITRKSQLKKYYYIRNYSETGYKDKSDIPNDIRKIAKEKTIRFDFADKVLISDIHYSGKEEFLLIQSEDGTKKAWVNRNVLCKGFAVIKQNDTYLYQLPDRNTQLPYKLQSADLGYIHRVEPAFSNCDFNFYIEHDQQKIYAGNRWIDNKNYIDDVDAAKQAYFLYLARSYASRQNTDEALNFIQKAIVITDKYDFLSAALYSLQKSLNIETSEAGENVNE